MVVLFSLAAFSGGAQQKIPEELLQKLEKLQGELSPGHQYMLFEDFAATGIFGVAASALVMDYSETAAEKEWFISVRKEGTAVFLRLAATPDGDMDFNKGSGWCLKPKGSAYAKYPYTNGKWGAAQNLPADRFASEIGQLQNTFILIPSENMSKDRVKLFEKAAYFDDLDVSLPN